jgi:hypothetical protein
MATSTEIREAKSRKLEIYWFTVSYKQILLWGTAIVLVASLGGFAFFWDYIIKKYNELVESEGTSRATSAKRKGHFSSLIGAVKVKKFNSVQWISADTQTVLDEGDYIQTSSGSFASIVFPDGTTYRMKQDSLIVVQENSEDPHTLAKTVSVHVTSGSIDLSTVRKEVSSSTTAVSAATATAFVNSESRMAVESNPATKTAQFLLQRGSGRIVSGSNSSPIGPYERITAMEGKLTKQKILAPPDLLTPNNIKPVIAREGTGTKIEFTWLPVPEAEAYRLRISNSSVFSKILREGTVQQPRYVTSGLEEGTYYWTVSSIDGNDKNSRDSDPNKFTLINRSFKENENDVLLSVEIIRISNIFEIIGRTDPGVSVVINEEPVTLMSSDGSFKHFTSPLPHKGKNLITITAQDRSGNSKTLRKEVYVD